MDDSTKKFDDVEEALTLTSDWPVVSAPKEDYFKSKEWEKDVQFVDRDVDEDRFFFKLSNGDIVEKAKEWDDV